MLANYFQKVKSFYRDNKSDLYIVLIIFLVGLSSFGLGRLSVLWPKKEPIQITSQTDRDPTPVNRGRIPAISNTNESASVISAPKSKYVASKNGTAYHFPWCPGALRIKEENKIWFETKEQAEKAGYKPAGNCEGL